MTQDEINKITELLKKLKDSKNGNSKTTVKSEFPLRTIAVLSLFAGLFILTIYAIVLVVNGYLNPFGEFSLENTSKAAPFIGSCVGVFFTLAGTLLVLENLQMTRINNERNQLLTQKNQFESIFFNLLTQQRQIKDGIKSKIHFEKKEIDLSTLDENFYDNLALRIKLDFATKPTQTKEDLIQLYNYWFTIYNSELGHFFRHMYHIVKFVDKNPYFNSVSNNENFLQKVDYIKILRAQLSNPELVLLALNGMTSQGAKFKTYIHDYDLLNNINLEEDMPTEYLSRVPGPKIIIETYPQLQ